MGLIENKAKLIVKNIVLNELNGINVMPGLCRYNFRCHLNAVNDAVINNEDSIAMCFYLHEDEPIIHFLNVNKEGEYIDNTLGIWSTEYEYYFIKFINKNDFFSVRDIFTDYREELHYRLPFYIRWFVKKDIF
jgi:hypothetical protein